VESEVFCRLLACSVESGVFCRLLACSVESEVLGLKAPVWRVECFAGF